LVVVLTVLAARLGPDVAVALDLHIAEAAHTHGGETHEHGDRDDHHKDGDADCHHDAHCCCAHAPACESVVPQSSVDAITFHCPPAEASCHCAVSLSRVFHVPLS
jgi:hypothetical protein